MTCRARQKITVVGAGIAGLTAARICKDNYHDVTVFEANPFIGGSAAVDENGNCLFGTHVFHTNSKRAWTFLSHYCSIKKYEHYVIARTNIGNIPIPFNYWSQFTVGDKTNEELIDLIFRHYTKRQWGINYEELPEETRSRIKIKREGTDCRYFLDTYQGLPNYKELFRNLSDGIKFNLGCKRDDWMKKDADVVFYSGSIDEYLRSNALSYRTCVFEDTKENIYCPVLNNCSSVGDWTRKHNYGMMSGNKTVIETPKKWEDTSEMRLYPCTIDPIQTQRHRSLMSYLPKNYFPIGRIGMYAYYDMDQVLLSTMDTVRRAIGD